MDSDAPQSIEKKERGIGPTLGIAVLVVLFVFGGIYFLLQEYQRFTAPPVDQNLNA